MGFINTMRGIGDVLLHSNRSINKAYGSILGSIDRRIADNGGLRKKFNMDVLNVGEGTFMRGDTEMDLGVGHFRDGMTNKDRAKSLLYKNDGSLAKARIAGAAAIPIAGVGIAGFGAGRASKD